MFFGRPKGQEYFNRGDPAVVDFDKNDLTIDAAWHDLDLSGVVGAGAKLVQLKLYMKATGATESVMLKTKGNSSNINIIQLNSLGANVAHSWGDCIYTDANGIIEYYVYAGGYISIDITIRGWFA